MLRPAMKRGIVIFILLTSGLLASGQDYFHWIKFAEEATEDGDHYGAMQYYSYAFALDSSDQALQYAYAESLLRTHHYAEAERLFLKVYLKGRGRFFPEGPGKIAQLLMYRGAYEEAIKFWRRAKRYALEGTPEEATIEARLRSCSYALSHPEANEDVEVVNAGTNINSTESDFGGELSPSGAFLYSSMRGAYSAKLELNQPDNYFAQLYQSQYSSEGFDSSQVYSSLVQSQSHRANPTLSLDGEYVYFSDCPKPDSCRIMRVSALDSLPLSCPYGVNNEGSNTQPFLFAHHGKEYIIWSSDREGGYGGMDLWMSRLVSGAKANNLGPDINSQGNEVCPFYDMETGILYFSSDFHEGYGGYDIFTVLLDTASYGNEVRNVGLPLNSTVNDLYYRKTADLEFLTSNRLGSMTERAPHCCNDIYLVNRDVMVANEDTIFTEVPQTIASVDQLKGLLPIALYFHNDVPNPGSQREDTEISYGETVRDYLELQTTYEDRYSSGLQAAPKDSAKLQMSRFFEEQVAGEYAKLEGVARLIRSELEQGKHIEIAIKGYASPLAESDYNRKLTQRRIGSILNYLHQLDEGALIPYMQGTDPALRIVPIPYGESESETYVSDNPQDAKNSIYSIAAARERRVEILRIVEVE